MAPPTIWKVCWFYESIEAVAKDEPCPTGLILCTGEDTRSIVSGWTYFRYCQGGQSLVRVTWIAVPATVALWIQRWGFLVSLDPCLLDRSRALREWLDEYRENRGRS